MKRCKRSEVGIPASSDFCLLANEAILVTTAGSLPIRAGKSFSASRKLGKTHQNVLIFVKSDGKKAANACGEIDFSALEDSHFDNDNPGAAKYEEAV